MIYEHCDAADAERVIKENIGNYRRGMLITDGVFSMDGDVAPLDKLYEVCERYGVITMVDDAHGEGVLGRGGRGIVDHFGLHGKFDLEIGTLSKAFGVVGGVIAGKKDRRGLDSPARAAVPVFQRRHAGGHRRVPGGG